MDEVQVEDPRTGRYRRLGRDEAIAVLGHYSAVDHRLQVLLRGLLWLAALSVIGATVWAVGLVALWGLPGGLALAWAWVTR